MVQVASATPPTELMRITLEHTGDFHGYDNRKVIIEVVSDELNITEMWEDLIRPALLGMTFDEATCDRLLGDYLVTPDEFDDDLEPMVDMDDYLARPEVQAELNQTEPHAVIDPSFKYRTRDGREVTSLIATADEKWSYRGYVQGCAISWTKEGRWAATATDHPLDLIPTGETA